MRTPIAVQIIPYDLEKDQSTLDTVRQAFVEYLQGVPRKSTRSKHGLMGPVGKILSEIKSGRTDAPSLKGYALRVHEATGKSPSPETGAALEQGIDLLVALLKKVPTPYHDRLLDRLDYGLFFALRSAEMKSKEERRQAWIAFLRSRYATEAQLSGAWGETIQNLDRVYLPRKVDGSQTEGASAKQRDIADFWQGQRAIVVTEDEDE